MNGRHEERSRRARGTLVVALAGAVLVGGATALLWMELEPGRQPEETPAQGDAQVAERPDPAPLSRPAAARKPARPRAPAPVSQPAPEERTEKAPSTSTPAGVEPGKRAGLPVRSPPPAPALPEASAEDEPEDANADEEDPDDYVWSLDRTGIRSAMRHAAPKFARCYRAWLRGQPGLEGRIVVEFVVVPDEEAPDRGRVTRVKVPEDTLNHAFVQGCVTNVVSALRFEPPPDGELTVRYPVLLKSKDPEEGGAGD